MIFIKYEPITATKAQVTTQHNFPLDPKDGMERPDKTKYNTQEEILQAYPNSMFVESIPEPQPPEGQMESGLYINPQTGEFTYEYADIPVPEATIIEQLQAQNAQMLLALVEGGLM